MRIVYQGKTKTGKEIVIRYPEMSDLEKLLDFINMLSDEHTFIRYQGEHETLESEKKFLKNRFKEINEKKSVHLVAFVDGEVSGASEVGMRDKTEKHIGSFGISIVKKFRGEGIGKLLMDQVITEAKKELANLKIIILEVYSTNEIAKSLYKKMGFKEYGMLPNGVVRGDKFEDAIFMYKEI